MKDFIRGVKCLLCWILVVTEIVKVFVSNRNSSVFTTVSHMFNPCWETLRQVHLQSYRKRETLLYRESNSQWSRTRTETSPSTFSMSPSSAEISEDFPQPTWPTTATREPWGTITLMLTSHSKHVTVREVKTQDLWMNVCVAERGVLVQNRFIFFGPREFPVDYRDGELCWVTTGWKTFFSTTFNWWQMRKPESCHCSLGSETLGERRGGFAEGFPFWKKWKETLTTPFK